MQVERDRGMERWLSAWLGDQASPALDAFEWDSGNSDKSTLKHGVTPALTMQLFAHPFVLTGRIVGPVEPRWILLGKGGRAGRGLALIFTIRGKLLRPISCRPMRDGETRRYEEAIED